MYASQPAQNPVDAVSLVYDSAPLSRELAILGRPRAILHASATAPLAHWFVRLTDVAPDGTSTLITGGGLNGAQRNSSTRPEPLEPGRTYPLEVNLHFTSWVFQPGHRIRVAIRGRGQPLLRSVVGELAEPGMRTLRDRRFVAGPHHHLSEKYLAAYVEERRWLEANQHNPHVFRDTILALVRGEGLSYDQLVAAR